MSRETFRQEQQARIEKRAYQLWEEKGGEPLLNWLEAERQIKAEGFAPRALGTFVVEPKDHHGKTEY